MLSKKAIVTGASRGIGFAIAKELADAGCTVLITGRKMEALKESAEKIGGRVIPFVWDIENLNEIEEKFNQAVEMLGGLDILVNNAGLFAQRSEWDKENLLSTNIDEWEKVMKVNTSALFFMMQSAVKYMRANGINGNILNVTSAAGYGVTLGAYCASKTAATALTRGWGKMFANDGITINGIAPGPVATEMNNWYEGDSMVHPDVPYGRFATIEEIGKLAMYLLSDAAKMTCGETVVLDGAYSIR